LDGGTGGGGSHGVRRPGAAGGGTGRKSTTEAERTPYDRLRTRSAAGFGIRSPLVRRQAPMRVHPPPGRYLRRANLRPARS
jgi:hypothetical protein